MLRRILSPISAPVLFVIRSVSRNIESGFEVTWRYLFSRKAALSPSWKFLQNQNFYTYSADMEVKGRVIVYSITGCPHCMRAKSTLQELGIPYIDVNLERFPQCREEVLRRTGRKTVPQIFFNATHIGGNDDLQNMVKDKERLNALLLDIQQSDPPEDAPVPPDPSTAKEDGGMGDFSCEPDEYAQLVKSLRQSGLIKDHRQGLKVHKNSFSGKEFVDWLVKTKELERDRALEIGQAIIDRHFGHQVKDEETFRDDDVYFRLLDDDESSALNAGDISECEARPAGELGEEIRKLILKIYNAFLSQDGKKVNYKGIAGSTEFQTYLHLTRELKRVQIADASREEKLAFFVNIYNAQVIHANITYGPPSGLFQRWKFFNTMRYIIGGYTYSLQDIENGVLRANRKGVGMFSRPFSKSDPRSKVALETPEPLIHFALVCGAKSCPPIKTFSTNGIYDQLKLAAGAFLEGDDGCQIIMNKRQIKLSQILKWYQEDFGNNKEEVLQWISNHMGDGEKKSQLDELLKSKNYKVSYMNYDWSLNS
ncbi:hypothetical protein CHS0354_011647 [Potamilus streckersoni]|uniref:DEP domain-containing protein n=2 Tax=Potamilus streckersoni TaxID=2493646 RepID=A0AAE0WGJ0_9BIVA|nr:hypothetical protein CHS0354_011647 [Potamilus streckersoni]